MCTTLHHMTPVEGSGKGVPRWFRLNAVHVGYDHPFHAQEEYSLNLDFVDTGKGPDARVAVELSRTSARALAQRILATLDEVDAHELSAVAAPQP